MREQLMEIVIRLDFRLRLVQYKMLYIRCWSYRLHESLAKLGTNGSHSVGSLLAWTYIPTDKTR